MKKKPTTKKWIRIIASLILLSIVLAAISLFMPYLIKLYITSGDLTLPKILPGHHFGLPIVVVFVMLASVFSVTFSKRQISTLVLSIFILILTYLTRDMVHYQGFDHHYDSKTGGGFALLFIAAILHFCTSSIALFLSWKKQAE